MRLEWVEWCLTFPKMCLPRTWEADLIWKVGLCRYKWKISRWHHPILGWTLNKMTSVVIKGEITHRGGGDMKTRQRLERWVYKPRDTKEGQQPPGARSKEWSVSLQKEPTLPGAFELLNCEKRNVYGFKPPSLWSFVMTAPGNWQAIFP